MRKLILIGGGAIVLFGAISIAIVTRSSAPARRDANQAASQGSGNSGRGAPIEGGNASPLPSQSAPAARAPAGAATAPIPAQVLDRSAETALLQRRNAERKLREEQRAAARAAASGAESSGQAAQPGRNPVRSGD